MPAECRAADCDGVWIGSQLSLVANGHRAQATTTRFSVQLRADLPPAPVAAQRRGEAGMRRVKNRSDGTAGKPSPFRPLQIELANGVEEPHADPGALPLRQDNEPAAARLDVSPLVSAAHCDVANRLPVDDADVAP